MTYLIIEIAASFLAGSIATIIALYIIGKGADEAASRKAAAQEEFYDLLLEQKFGEWIPVTDALPELSGHYLVTVSRDMNSARGIPVITNVDVDRYNCSLNKWELYDGHVTAWMVPPRGYKRKEKRMYL